MNTLLRLTLSVLSTRSAPDQAVPSSASRRTLLGQVGSLAALAATVALTPAVHAQSVAQTPEQVKNVVLVHGLFADGSSWGKVIPLLQAQGLHVTSVQNPLSSLQDDAAAVKRALTQQDGPTLLVAHSYGGMVATEAGTDPKVAGIVYIAARAPDAGEDYPALTREFNPAPASAGIQWDANGWGSLSEQAFLKDFAGDLSEAEARSYYAVQQPFARAITQAKTTVAAWHLKPTWYAVCTQDRTIDPDLQRFMAKRMGAKTIELPTSHVSLLSHPKEIADLIIQATKGQR